MYNNNEKASERMCVKLPNNIIIPFEDDKDIDIEHKKFNNTHLPMHRHQYFEFELIISGGGIHTINETPYPIRKGEMHFMKLTDIHEFFFEGKSELYMVKFPTSYLPPDMSTVILNCSKDMIVYFDEKEFPKIEYLYKILMEEHTINSIYSQNIIKNVILTLILMFFRKLNLNETNISYKNDIRINDIILFMQNNFQHPLNLNEIAKNFYMNNEYFSRYFKKHMGIGPKEYLIGIRMDYAKKLVCESQLKILDICMACGYNSMMTFHRDFKNKYNCTPKQMRKENN